MLSKKSNCKNKSALKSEKDIIIRKVLGINENVCISGKLLRERKLTELHLIAKRMGIPFGGVQKDALVDVIIKYKK